MARVQLLETVLDPQGRLLVAVNGGEVTITDPGGDPVTLYAGEVSSDEIDQPLTIRNGRVEPEDGGDVWIDEGSYARVAELPGTVPRTVTQRFEIVKSGASIVDAGPINLRASGVLADNTNQTTAVQALLTAAGAGGGKQLVRLESGTVRLDSGITLPSNVTLDLATPSSVLDFSNLASSTTAITCAGTVGSDVALTATAQPGDIVLGVAAGAQTAFAAGDWVKIEADTYYAGNTSAQGGVNQYIGEQVQVDSVASGVINLRWPLAGGPYTTAATAVVKKVTHAKAKITGQGRIVGAGDQAQVGIRLTNVRDCRIEGIRLEKFVQEGVLVTDGINVVVDGFTAIAGEHTNLLAYGVRFNSASQDCSVVNSYFQDYRHAVDSGGSTTTPGICRRITYHNNKVVDSHSAALSTHSGCEDVTITNNSLYNPGTFEPSGGIAVRSPRAIISGNHIRNPATYGMWLHNQSTQNTRWTVTGNRIENPGSTYGILIDASLTTTPQITVLIDGITVTGNVIDNTPSHGIYVNGGVAGDITAVAVTGNVLSHIGGTGILFDNADFATITGNVLTNIGDVGISAQDILSVAIGSNSIITYGGAYGIDISGQRSTVTGNTILGTNGYGINIGTGLAASVTGNQVRAPGGIQVVSATHVAVGSNELTADTAAAGLGVNVAASSNCAISGNVLKQFDQGVVLASTATSCVVTGNEAATCTIPVAASTGTGHVIYGNTPRAIRVFTAQAALAINLTSRWVQIDGTADITSITSQPLDSELFLRFTGTAASNGLVHSTALDLGGSNIHYTPGLIVHVVSDGTNWHKAG